MEKIVDIGKETCPAPMIKARKAINEAAFNQMITFIIDRSNNIGRKHILMAAKNLNCPIIEDAIVKNNWKIVIKKTGR